MYPSILSNFLRLAADKVDSGECSKQDMEILNTAMRSLMDESHPEYNPTIIPMNKKESKTKKQ